MRYSPCSRPALALWLLLLTAFACGPAHRAGGQRPEERQRAEPLSEPPPPPTSRPWIPDGPGMEALRGWALTCYDIGLRHNPIFARGGTVIIRWTADRGGDLLQLDFATDTFRGWEINPAAETLADCVSRLARAGKIRWSASGTAPLRFSPTRAP